MIIIVDEREQTYSIGKEDTFNLYITQNGIRSVLISREFNKSTYIDYWCIYIFTDNDGCHRGNNIAAFMGQKDNLPDELISAKRLKDLTPKQSKSLIKTSTINFETL